MSYLNGLYESSDILISGISSSNEILNSDNTFTGNDTFTNPITTNGITNTGTFTTDDFQFSNVSSSIYITNWDFSSPTYPLNDHQLIYSGTGTYTGRSGWTLSSPGFTQYDAYITHGTLGGLLPTIPVASGNSLQISFQPGTSNAVMYFISSSYGWVKAEYLMTFDLYCNYDASNFGNTIDVYVYDTLGTLYNVLYGANPTLTGKWGTYRVDFSLPSFKNVYFKFVFSNTDTGSGCNLWITNILVRQNNCLSITDTATGTISTMAGSENILNSLYVRNGLQVDSGGLNVSGTLFTKTTYGVNNLAINSTFGSSSASNNANNIAIGDGALQASTVASSNIAIGASTLKEATIFTQNIALGFNIDFIASNVNYCVLMSPRARLYRGGQTIQHTVVIGGNNNTQGSGQNYSVSIGSNIFNNYNGGGQAYPDYCSAIGYSSQNQGADFYNTSIGAFSLNAMNGSSDAFGGVGFTGYQTRYNSALGYSAGSSFQQYNNCTFLGAFADTNINNLSNATAIGYNCKVGSSNTIQLGSNSETVAFSGDLTNGTKTLTNAKFSQVANCFNNSSVNSYSSITITDYSISWGDSEICVINSTSVLNIYLPGITSTTQLGAKFVILKGKSVKGMQISISNSGSGLFYNTQFANTYTSTYLSKTANYITCVAVGNGSAGQIDWLLYSGQDFQSGTFNLSGNYYIGSQASQKIISQTTTIPSPYYEYYSISTNFNIQITLPRITPTTFDILNLAITTSSTTGQRITFRKTIGSTTSMVVQFFAYTSGNSFYNQVLYDTTNTALTNWLSPLSITFVPLSFIKTTQPCSITVNWATPSSSTITPITIIGTTATNIFTPTVITTSTASTAGTTTLTLSATNANVAIGQYVSATGMTLGAYIVSGSGLTWTLNVATTLTSRTFSFYSRYMTGGNAITPSTVFQNAGTGYTLSHPTALSTIGQLVYPTAVNYATNNIPTFTLNVSVGTIGSTTFNLYPITLACGSNLDPFIALSNDTMLPQFLGNTIDDVSFKCLYSSTTLVPTIQAVYDSTATSGTMAYSSVGMPCMAWFQE